MSPTYWCGRLLTEVERSVRLLGGPEGLGGGGGGEGAREVRGHSLDPADLMVGGSQGGGHRQQGGDGGLPHPRGGGPWRAGPRGPHQHS